MVKVKICGITNLEDALAAVDAGCDALGFVFYRRSRRYVRPEKAARIIRRLPKAIVTAGVFVNCREATVRRISKQCGLSLLQFHGNESPEFCARFRGFKVVKAFRLRGPEDARRVKGYDTFGYLFDTYVRGNPGGTGKSFDWSWGAAAAGSGKIFFLSGGLDSSNVRCAIERLKPQWVDVSSSVERGPGLKDPAKVRSFIRAAKKK
jgi:phosphoribosylanthranilate isomerase